MEPTRLMGVGCFGRPDRVARILNKMVKIYGRLYEINLPEAESINGFYIGFVKNGLNLSLFKKGVGSRRVFSNTVFPLSIRKNTLN